MQNRPTNCRIGPFWAGSPGTRPCLPEGPGQGGKLRDAQPLPPHVRGQAAAGQQPGQLLLGDLPAEGGPQGVEQGLAPLGEGRPDHPEKEGRVLDLRRQGPGVSRSTEEVTLGAGRKQSGGTSKSSSVPAWT